ncbi:hypothetical protein F2Q70_00017638 [Brassica cretica]|uniref:Uncharacterized protein n=1 Tax=Brassica cretica TaxID=69181 RepID=A0A8S9KMF0_BRACR|nr:hypothetical protein F2Q70_00017638 [Brassica cretica]KAF2596410.1 hypothetical protein F2Q68_00010569 [Brassica cretica]
MEGSPYRKFFFSRGKGAVPGTRPGELHSGEPGFLLAGTQRSVSCLGPGGIQYMNETFPSRWELVGVGRKSDGEAGNVCIKGDASSHTQDTCAASVAILGLSSGRTSVCIS